MREEFAVQVICVKIKLKLLGEWLTNHDLWTTGNPK